MPTIKVRDIGMYYEIHGTGKPLVLIEGLSYATWMWFRQVPELAKHFQVIVFDNRGVGKTDKPDMPYTTKLMAEDCAELVKKLGYQRINVLGASMGGMIAQEFALNFPELVERLILCCTTHGGPNNVQPEAEVIELLKNPPGDTPEEKVKCALIFTTQPEFREQYPELVQQIWHDQLTSRQPLRAYLHQAEACFLHNTEDRLQQINCPTLVAVGQYDRIIPKGNSERLHRMIAGSQLKIIPNSGHLFFIEKADELNQWIVEFLQPA